MKKSKDKGITLIALVITIIILLILAGVAIATLTGENGILKKANTAKETTEQKSAREKLELVLIELGMDKRTDSKYNENEYINDRLSKNQMTVLENDIVLVDKWLFLIDRTVPTIKEDIGQGEINNNIIINMEETINADFTKSIITIEITSQKEITSITINGEELLIPEKQGEKYIIQKEVTKNGTYSVIAKDVDGKFNIASKEIIKIVDDLDIYNAEQLSQFRDNVKQGAKYEEKVVTLKNNIDMSKVCYKVDGTVENDISWEPISSNFKGTFNGDGHEIENLYINTNSESQGLFSNNNGTIQNLGIDENSTIKGSNLPGAIVGCNNSAGTIQKCYSKATVIAVRDEYSRAGGIAGQNNGLITMCYNEGLVQAESRNSYAQTGGIAGINYNNSEISKCYNKGEIISIAQTIWSPTGGIVGIGYEQSVTIKDCYNRGTIRLKTTKYHSDIRIGGVVGDIAGTNFSNAYNIGEIIVEDSYGSYIQIGGVLGCTQRASVSNNIWCLDNYSKCIGRLQGDQGSTTNYGIKSSDEMKKMATTLGSEWKDDKNNKNDGYPILEWQ